MIILAIDPGTTQSAEVLYSSDGATPRLGALAPVHGLMWVNGGLLDRLLTDSDPINGVVVCEMIQSMGMAVGQETFETVRWIGRFEQAVKSRGGRFETLYRPAIKAQICGSAKAKDANVRMALIDRFGGQAAMSKGKKCPSTLHLYSRSNPYDRCRNDNCKKCDGSGWLQKPGPLAGITSHMWAALAVAVTWAETREEAAGRPPAGRAQGEAGTPTDQ